MRSENAQVHAHERSKLGGRPFPVVPDCLAFPPNRLGSVGIAGGAFLSFGRSPGRATADRAPGGAPGRQGERVSTISTNIG